MWIKGENFIIIYFFVGTVMKKKWRERDREDGWKSVSQNSYTTELKSLSIVRRYNERRRIRRTRIRFFFFVWVPLYGYMFLFVFFLRIGVYICHFCLKTNFGLNLVRSM